MLGVKLCAKYTDTRSRNGDDMVKNTADKINLWKSGKFMPISARLFSVNTYIFSKLWYKTAVLDVREEDIKKINSSVKSWLYADCLIKPEETLLHR